MRLLSLNLIFIVLILTIFSITNANRIFSKKRLAEKIFKQRQNLVSTKTNLKASLNLAAFSSYNFPNLLNFDFPTSSQSCSYFETLETQFQNAIVELENMQFSLDSAPETIKDTFTEMKDNFTNYNARGGDQLEESILNQTDQIVAAAPNILTLSQREEYMNDLTTTLDKIKVYVTNYACTFQVVMKSYDGNHVCVSSTGGLVSVDASSVTDNCDNFIFEFDSFYGADETTRNYCIKSVSNSKYLVPDLLDTLNAVSASGEICEYLWKTSNSKTDDYFNFHTSTGYLSVEDNGTINAGIVDNQQTEQFTITFL